MEKPSFKLVGAPCGHHGHYTFYKALRVTGQKERVIAIGDFFFVRLWPDSQLVSIGELQLLWRDRVSEQTLVSLRLYCLPENTPLGRSKHGQDEVVAINEKVVIQADDLPTWLCSGDSWSTGLLAPHKGEDQHTDAVMTSQPLHRTKIDFSDVDREKSALPSDPSAPGVVVFSYGRYCRYRAIVARLAGVESQWLRNSLVAALGGYHASTTNTRILYCRDTFEYPELEGHEFVCNHLAPRLKGRPRGRRRRPPRSRSHSPSSRSSDSDDRSQGYQPTRHIEPKARTQAPRRLSLRKGTSEEEGGGGGAAGGARVQGETAADRAFLKRLCVYGHHTLTDVSLRTLYARVSARGGYDEVCRRRLWKDVHCDQPVKARNVYERYLLSYETQERRNGKHPPTADRLPLHGGPAPTIDVPDSPPPPHTDEAEHKSDTEQNNEEDTKTNVEKHKYGDSRTFEAKTYKNVTCDARYNDESIDLSRKDTNSIKIDNETGEMNEDVVIVNTTNVETSKAAEEFNKEFLDSLSNNDTKEDCENEKPLLKIKPVSQLLEPNLRDEVGRLFEDNDTLSRDMCDRDKARDERDSKSPGGGSPVSLSELALSLGSAEGSLLDLAKQHDVTSVSHLNGHTDNRGSRPAGRSSLRAVRVKPPRGPLSGNNTPVPLRPDSSGASSSPPSVTNCHSAPPVTNCHPVTPVTTCHSAPPVTNFGIHRPAPSTSDDEIQEVPYKPKTPEIIDLDEYPESPQAFKKKKLDILKERGLEVTAVPPTGVQWGTVPPAVPLNPLITPAPILLNPAMQHQIMQQASLFQMYNVIPQNYANGIQPPKVIQATCIYGNTGPEKTVYGNPKDQFMPPPHILHGAPVVKPRNFTPAVERPDILDLSKDKPAVEIVKIPQNSPAKSYTLLDGKAVVGSNLEITLVSPKTTPQKTQTTRQPQKRSSNGKFMSTKTPPKETVTSRDRSERSHASPKTSPNIKKATINIPSYQVRDDPSPTSSTGSQSSITQQNIQNSLLKSQLDMQKNNQNPNHIAQLLELQKNSQNLANLSQNQNLAQLLELQKSTQNLASMGQNQNLAQLLEMQKNMPMSPFIDPLYMNALYSSLAGHMDHRQMAMYRDFMANQFRYSSLLGNTPTTKN